MKLEWSSNPIRRVLRKEKLGGCSCTEGQPCEKSAKGGPSLSHKEKPEETNFATTLFMDFQPPEL